MRLVFGEDIPCYRCHGKTTKLPCIICGGLGILKGAQGVLEEEEVPPPLPPPQVNGHAQASSRATEWQKTEALKEQGQDRATSVSLEWAFAARAWVQLLPRGHRFTAEDLRQAVGSPPSSRAMGGVFTWANRHKMARQVGFETASRRQRHHGVLGVWEAL
jgi:hypothetical protein